ncbi:MAG TPA: tetratricopeptide repeat protein, partial [Saprospiraceae bacterium]|nr:tetratricopeptide repeat protein [Saprospiraceae bacterium]
LIYFEQMSHLFKELHEAFPQNVDFKNGLAISYSKLGETHSALGDLRQALGYFEDYNRLKKELYEAFPQNVGFKNGLAISYSRLGGTHSALGDLQQALKYCEDSNRLGKELYEAFPENVDFKSNYAESLAVFFGVHKIFSLPVETTYLDMAIQLFQELYSSAQRPYYQQKINICLQMKRADADLKQLISEMIAF